MQALRAAEDVYAALLAKAVERGNVEAALKAADKLRITQVQIGEHIEGQAAAAIVDDLDRLRAQHRIALAKGSAGPAAQIERDIRDTVRQRAGDAERRRESEELATTPDDALDGIYLGLCEDLAPHVRRKLGLRLIASAPTLAERQATAAGPQ
jgi:hypothetical protein